MEKFLRASKKNIRQRFDVSNASVDIIIILESNESTSFLGPSPSPFPELGLGGEDPGNKDGKRYFPCFCFEIVQLQ